VFFEDEDREVYLAMLASACQRFELDVWAYCLMTNHVHLLAVPRQKLSMAAGVGRTHMRYSRRINTERGWTGHLWANRYHSSLLDNEHLWNAVRYVEQNPVRAGLVGRCEDWIWSSTRAHAGLLEMRDPLLCEGSPFPGHIQNWSEWVNSKLDAEFCRRIRANTATGRPTGSEEFMKRIEAMLERDLAPARKRGRPPKVQDEPDLTVDLFS
jgi:putative transposase